MSKNFRNIQWISWLSDRLKQQRIFLNKYSNTCIKKKEKKKDKYLHRNFNIQRTKTKFSFKKKLI